MPTFHPPLAQETNVDISTTSSYPYVQLNFFATFTDDEDSTGSWEIWTDLPRLNDQGAIISELGEWRAIPFEPCADSQAGPTTFALSSVIPASVGHQYSYTYRHITTFGETRWLGGMGGNGFIKITEGQSKEDKEIKCGSWSERPEGLKKSEWKGIAIGLQRLHGLNKPLIHNLPSDSHISAQIALLSYTSPIHSTSFSTPTTSFLSTTAQAPTQHLTFYQDSKSFSIAPNSAIPDTANSSSPSYATGRSSLDTISAAFAAANAKDVQLAQTSDPEVAAILVSSSEVDGRQSHLIIHAPSLSSPKDLTITLPANTRNDSPVAIFTGAKEKKQYLAETKTPQFSYRLGSGSTAEILQLAQFVELRGTGAGDSVWLCAPEATAVEIGEEEIPQPEQTSSSSPIPPAREVPQVKIDEEQRPMSSELNAEPVERVNVPINEPQPISEQSRSIHNQSEPSKPAHGWWLFRFIGRFFANFWELLFWPFRSRSTITDVSETAEQPREENDNVDPSVNERTPLLQSQSMSRESSSSSTAFDPLATPTSMFTNKEDQKPKITATDGAVTPIGQGIAPILDLNSADLNLKILSLANAGTIRSYTQMTFNHLPPFQFLLPPNSNEIASKLKISVKEKSAKQWEEIKPDFKPQNKDNICDELIVQGHQGTGGLDWQVQVERI
ncbi:uncharacterized protein L201_006284 [Kwoniella dendrophila CBS 6074]|uniref:Uncharacterized protein n=1 Tax=Kwoniella dendrophila CBS 6074 TaxID=1295534 RepID=A0AAX4K193_9TREE